MTKTVVDLLVDLWVALIEIMATPHAVTLLGVLLILSILLGWNIGGKDSDRKWNAKIIFIELLVFGAVGETVRGVFFVTHDAPISLRPIALTIILILVAVSGVILGVHARSVERSEAEIFTSAVKEVITEVNARNGNGNGNGNNSVRKAATNNS